MNKKVEPINIEKIDNPDGSYVKKAIYTKPTDDGRLSAILNYDSNGKILNSISYKDNNFENIYRKNSFKHFKDENFIYLREYEKSENKIYSEITKVNKDNEILYTKQYKFKGLFAKILFWLAR